MSYKFQLGGYRASGSLVQEGPLTVSPTLANDGTVIEAGVLSASAGMSGSSLVVSTVDGTLYGLGGDGALAISKMNTDWTNAGRTVADGGTFTAVAVSTSGLTYDGTAVTSTGAELNLVDGCSAGTIVNSKAVIYSAGGAVRAGSVVITDGNTLGVNGDTDMVTYTGGSNIAIANDLDFNIAKTSGLQLGGSAVTSTAAELNLLDTAAAGTVINSKAVIYGAAGQVNATTVSSSTGMTGSSLIIGAAGTTGTSISNNGTVKSVNLVGTTSLSSSQGITGSSLQMGAYGLTNDGRLSVGTVAGSTGTFSGILKTDDTTDATSKTDGSLQTDGGLSVAKAIYNGTAATLAADSGVVTLGSSNAATFSAVGVLNINNTTDASNTTDGSLQTDGGLSVAKKVYIGTDLSVQGDATIGSDQADTCTINGQTVELANVPTTTAMALADDSIYFVDAGDGYVKQRTWAVIAGQMAGSGLSATNGVLSVDGQGEPAAITNGGILQEGTNYLTGTLLAGITVGLPEASAPSVGDKIILKAAAGLSSLVTVTVHTSGSHTVDGSSGNVILESPYAAVTFQYLASGSWGIL